MPGRTGLWRAADQSCHAAAGQGLMALGELTLSPRLSTGEIKQGQTGLSGDREQPHHLHRLLEAVEQSPVGAVASQELYQLRVMGDCQAADE